MGKSQYDLLIKAKNSGIEGKDFEKWYSSLSEVQKKMINKDHLYSAYRFGQLDAEYATGAYNEANLDKVIDEVNNNSKETGDKDE